MANYTRTHIHIFPYKDSPSSVEAFEELCSFIDEGDIDSLCEAFEIDSNDNYLYFDYNCIENNIDSIELGLLSKGFVPIYNLGEAIIDNYPVSVYATWCDEMEGSLIVPDKDWRNHPDEYLTDKWFNDSCRCGSIKLVITDYDEDNDEPIYNDEDTRLPYYYPQTDKEKHEVFLMAWDGWKPPSGGDEDFFNQLDLDESDLYDEYDDLIPYEDWIESKFH